jgi:hypothetical protein
LYKVYTGGISWGDYLVAQEVLDNDDLDSVGGIWVATAESDEVANVRSGGLEDDTDTGRLDGEGKLLGALGSVRVSRDDLLGTDDNNDVLGSEESTNTGTSKIGKDEITIFRDGRDGGEPVVSRHGLTTELGCLGLVSLGEDVSVEVLPAVLALLQVVNETDFLVGDCRGVHDGGSFGDELLDGLQSLLGGIDDGNSVTFGLKSGSSLLDGGVSGDGGVLLPVSLGDVLAELLHKIRATMHGCQ